MGNICMKVLKISANVWENESRDKRELSVYKALGAEVAILAKGNVNDMGRKENMQGFDVYRYTTRPYAHIPVILNRVIAVLKWAKFAKKLNCDIISGHNLDGWIIGCIAKLLSKSKKIMLIYDSHEFELGRSVKRTRAMRRIIQFCEGLAIKKSIFTIVVNDCIADELVKIYKLETRPVVIRNIPERWEIDESKCQSTRTELLNSFHK